MNKFIFLLFSIVLINCGNPLLIQEGILTALSNDTIRNTLSEPTLEKEISDPYLRDLPVLYGNITYTTDDGEYIDILILRIGIETTDRIEINYNDNTYEGKMSSDTSFWLEDTKNLGYFEGEVIEMNTGNDTIIGYYFKSGKGDSFGSIFGY